MSVWCEQVCKTDFVFNFSGKVPPTHTQLHRDIFFSFTSSRAFRHHFKKRFPKQFLEPRYFPHPTLLQLNSSCRETPLLSQLHSSSGKPVIGHPDLIDWTSSLTPTVPLKLTFWFDLNYSLHFIFLLTFFFPTFFSFVCFVRYFGIKRIAATWRQAIKCYPE